MRRHLSATLTAATIAALFWVSGQVAEAPHCDSSEAPMTEGEYLVIALLNDDRATVGLAALIPDDAIAAAAAVKLADQQARGLIDHAEADGRMVDQLLTDCAVPHGWAGEILAIRYPTPEDAVAGWRASPAHMDVVRIPAFERAGVAGSDGTWVMLFTGGQ